MRRLTAWIGGIASGVVAYRFWRRHRSAEAGAEPEVAADSDERAEELRAKLAESRVAEPATDDAPAAEAPPDKAPREAAEPPPPPESPDERRRRVHEEGRAAIDEMKSEE